MDDMRRKLLDLENRVQQLTREVENLTSILTMSYPQILLELEDMKSKFANINRRLSSSDNSMLVSFLQEQSPDSDSLSNGSAETKHPESSPRAEQV